jgi:hypothetical protein
MRETRSSGSVRGASGDGRPYRERYLAVRKASKNDRSSSDLGRSPQLSLRAALDHDGLKAPPTLPVDPRKATYCPPHVYRVGTSVTRF